eukprot:m.597675 g.597675  ORF g.597675 m.597675 type:complete len:693 (+) comp22417_c0_seq3:572-2650(+)
MSGTSALAEFTTLVAELDNSEVEANNALREMYQNYAGHLRNLSAVLADFSLLCSRPTTVPLQRVHDVGKSTQPNGNKSPRIEAQSNKANGKRCDSAPVATSNGHSSAAVGRQRPNNSKDRSNSPSSTSSSTTSSGIDSRSTSQSLSRRSRSRSVDRRSRARGRGRRSRSRSRGRRTRSRSPSRGRSRRSASASPLRARSRDRRRSRSRSGERIRRLPPSAARDGYRRHERARDARGDGGTGRREGAIDRTGSTGHGRARQHSHERAISGLHRLSDSRLPGGDGPRGTSGRQRDVDDGHSRRERERDRGSGHANDNAAFRANGHRDRADDMRRGKSGWQRDGADRDPDRHTASDEHRRRSVHDRRHDHRDARTTRRHDVAAEQRRTVNERSPDRVDAPARRAAPVEDGGSERTARGRSEERDSTTQQTERHADRHGQHAMQTRITTAAGDGQPLTQERRTSANPADASRTSGTSGTVPGDGRGYALSTVPVTDDAQRSTAWAVTHSSALDKKRGRVAFANAGTSTQSTRTPMQTTDTPTPVCISSAPTEGMDTDTDSGVLQPLIGGTTHGTPPTDAAGAMRSGTVLKQYRNTVAQLARHALPLAADEIRTMAADNLLDVDVPEMLDASTTALVKQVKHVKVMTFHRQKIAAQIDTMRQLLHQLLSHGLDTRTTDAMVDAVLSDGVESVMNGVG